MDKLDKLLEYVTAQEEKYYSLAAEAFNEGNMVAYMIHTAEASAFGRVSWAIEEILKEKNNT